MKKYLLLTATLLFFVIINAEYFLECWIGSWMLPIYGLLFIAYLALAAIFLIQTEKHIKNWFRDRFKTITLAILIIVLGTTYFKPFGIYNFEKLEGKNWIVAQHRGVASCTTTIKFKDDNKTFIERSVCFGIKKTKGTYIRHGDTLKLYYATPQNVIFNFAVIQLDSNAKSTKTGKLTLYANNRVIPFTIVEYNIE